MEDPRPLKPPYPPLWARKLIVLGIMMLAIPLMYLSFPVEDQSRMMWIFTNIGVPLFFGGLLLIIGIRLVRWAT